MHFGHSFFSLLEKNKFSYFYFYFHGSWDAQTTDVSGGAGCASWEILKGGVPCVQRNFCKDIRHMEQLEMHQTYPETGQKFGGSLFERVIQCSFLLDYKLKYLLRGKKN